MDDSTASAFLQSQANTLPLDAEIQEVRRQIQILTRRRATLTAALLSSPSSQTLLARARADAIPSPHIRTFEKRIEEQKRRNIQNVYRMCAGATLFEARDPDPNAVDEGRIIGVRIEVFDQRTRTFRTPSYLLLNRPHQSSTFLRIHRHTIPPCIPLPAIAARYLPQPHSSDEKKPKSQNLPRLVWELRRELVSYHRRQNAIAKLDEEARIASQLEQGERIKNVKAVDAECKDLRVVWMNGTCGRIRLKDDGAVEDVLVLDEDGKRRRSLERKLLRAERIEKMVLTL